VRRGARVLGCLTTNYIAGGIYPKIEHILPLYLHFARTEDIWLKSALKLERSFLSIAGRIVEALRAK